MIFISTERGGINAFVALCYVHPEQYKTINGLTSIIKTSMRKMIQVTRCIKIELNSHVNFIECS